MNFRALKSAFGKTSPEALDLADGAGPAAWCRTALQKLYAAMGFKQFQGSYATKRVKESAPPPARAWALPAPEPK